MVHGAVLLPESQFAVTILLLWTGLSKKKHSGRFLKYTRREKYSNVLQTHTSIVIVGQVRILVFHLRYSQTVCSRLGDAISKFGEKRFISHLFQNHYMCLKNVTVFFSPSSFIQASIERLKEKRFGRKWRAFTVKNRFFLKKVLVFQSHKKTPYFWQCMAVPGGKHRQRCRVSEPV